MIIHVPFLVREEECYIPELLYEWTRLISKKEDPELTIADLFSFIHHRRKGLNKRLGWTQKQCVEAGRLFADELRAAGFEDETIMRHATKKEGGNS